MASSVMICCCSGCNLASTNNTAIPVLIKEELAREDRNKDGAYAHNETGIQGAQIIPHSNTFHKEKVSHLN